MSQRIARRSGQSMVEFALLVPILLLLVMGFFDLARAAYTQSVVANAAREGARAAIIPSRTDADIRAAVKARAIGVTITDANIVITPSPTRLSGQPVSVLVTSRFYPVTPFIIRLMSGGTDYMDLDSTATMTVE